LREEAELGEVLEAVGDDGVEDVVESLRVEWLYGGGVAVDVILKVLT
jgi:hypothetical protein